MTEFCLGLAGLSVGVRVLHEATRDFCTEYVVDGPPDVSVALSQAHIDAERVLSARQREREGLAPYDYDDPYLETLALYRAVAEVLVVHDIVVFHGAVLAWEGRAYVFTAPSGTGKTTHVRNWLARVPGCHVLNGDKPLLRVEPGRVAACGTPWMGKEQMGRNECLPLAGLCLLRRDTYDHIEPLGTWDALPTLVAQTHRPEGAAAQVRAVELAGRIGELVPLWQLGCTPAPESALVSWQAMTQREGR